MKLDQWSTTTGYGLVLRHESTYIQHQKPYRVSHVRTELINVCYLTSASSAEMSGRSASSVNRTSSASIASSTAGGVVATAVAESSTSLRRDWEGVGVARGCSLKRDEGTPSGKLPVGCRNWGPNDAELDRVRRWLRSRPGDTSLSGEMLPAWGSSG